MMYPLTFIYISVIALCCFFNCRIPRTKQEIDLEYEKKLLAKRMTKQLDRVPLGYNLKIMRGKLFFGKKNIKKLYENRNK